MEGGAFNIPDGLMTFQLGAQSFKLDPTEALEQGDKIRERLKDSTEAFAEDKAFAAWIEEKAKVKLNPTQASFVWQTIVLEYRRSQKSFTDALESLDSTASTHSV